MNANFPVGTKGRLADTGEACEIAKPFGPHSVKGQGMRDGYLIKAGRRSGFVRAGDFVAEGSGRKNYSHLRLVGADNRGARKAQRAA